MQDHYLGAFEEIVLLAICGVGEDAYAVSIHRFIRDRTGQAPTLGSVYRSLNRLEQKGYVASWMGAVEHIRGGKRKRFYRATSLGRTCVYDARIARERLWEGLDRSPAFKLDPAGG